MTLSDPGGSPLVVAMRFDEERAAEDLAAWCGGHVRHEEDPHIPARLRTVVEVPTRHGSRAAALGDWIVRRSEDDFEPCSPEEFAAHHEPHPAGQLAEP